MSDKLKEIINKQSKQADSAINHTDDIVQLVGFIIGQEEYAVPILTIQEIIKPIAWTRVPQTPKYILGVFNLRGSVIPLIDLRVKFGLKPKKHNEETRFFVLKQGDDVAGFVIDRLTMALRIKKSDIGPAPDSVAGDDSMIDGVGKQNDKILTILKVKKLLERDF
ncbi:MAG: purine-binding chemotaxis protein CheW [Epsilonproteobacteria bacterium]|nr:purine-binding chemotaxis protein CheW [Campylobacterota bacterium]OIO14599.1 MAG: chemotaxis protein CheW [Helicobacteraceae bacterium CG1_02_36_14]PIP09554.1 MAG: chemotaxis protein CheW [Sulfurimonas sp. CG23_combo_of_CG06-09_8_20_14_all_36_33]PIS25283.1 MAG: chemotaxis protein CheW [Sulfurimonas sp. CG08_land_8_20_14_0_20_36_33]PIU33541.1 MAG: chemotaxis protein CheW [Sulfurimonas sp. CG07_land_8_20_14_0_80_36_56]PIV04010.1 MAG: chemotaxis protein CheW [Sulfurimonas sp. CG03_land_8_20_1